MGNDKLMQWAPKPQLKANVEKMLAGDDDKLRAADLVIFDKRSDDWFAFQHLRYVCGACVETWGIGFRLAGLFIA